MAAIAPEQQAHQQIDAQLAAAGNVEAASRRLEDSTPPDLYTYFDPLAPVEITAANLPHWRQEGVTYFVTFRLVDSLPQEKLEQWREEREQWLKTHPLPLNPVDQKEYHQRFTATIQHWLDQGTGSCVLDIPECRAIVESALQHFHNERYLLGEYVVAGNHVHALLVPLPDHELSDILHSIKSFTSKKIGKVEAASCRLQEFWDTRHARKVEAASRRLESESTTSHYPAPPRFERPVWQKESFDHIVRSPEALERILEYIRNHSAWCGKRQDAASTCEAARQQLINAACAPFDNPAT